MGDKLRQLFVVVVLSLVVIGFSGLTFAADVIIDNGGAGTSSTGTWYLSAGPNPYGGSSLYANSSATYTYEASVSGSQEVSLHWTYYSNRCTSVPVDIYDGSTLLDTVYVNHKVNGGQWNSLGTYDFSGTATIVITSQGGCTTCADAVKFTSTGGGGGITSLDDIPSRIAGDSGVVSGTWSTPYTDASNATDGDYSTYASGRMLGIDIAPVEAFVTWDMGQVFDVSIVTIKFDIVPADTFNFNMPLHLEFSQDNINWVMVSTPFSMNFFAPLKEITGLVPGRSRYIRLKGVAYNVSDGEIRIYEIKVR